MERYTEEQRVIIVKTRYKYGESYAETVRKLRGIFGRRNATYQLTVKRMIKKYEETGSIMDSKLPVRHRTGRSLDSFAAVSESVAESHCCGCGGNHTANYRGCVKWKESKAALAKRAPEQGPKSTNTGQPVAPNAQRAGPSAE